MGRLIEDPTAKGIHQANYTRRVAGDKPWALKPEHDWILTPVEPLITEDVWQKCNDMLEERKTKLARPAKRAVHLFAGLATCECGKKMYVPTNSPKYIPSAAGDPKTIGDHIKKRRLKLRLMQQQVADRLEVHIESVKNWEHGVTSPGIHKIPRIIEFLGYSPESEPNNIPERMHTFRVLDPACGSGNFLYIAYREMKRLEARLYKRIDREFPKHASAGEGQKRFSYLSAQNFYGPDILPFAVEIAKVTLSS